MNTSVKALFIVTGVFCLSACVTDQKFKVRFEPTLPIPYLIVPDEGDKDNPSPYYQNYPQQYTPPPPQYAPPPPRYRDYREENDRRRRQDYEQDDGHYYRDEN